MGGTQPRTLCQSHPRILIEQRQQIFDFPDVIGQPHTKTMTLKPINVASAASFKAVRLAALQDTPTAFGSTYAKESPCSDAEWAQRVTQWNGDRSICYLAWDEEQPCGIAAGFLDREHATKAHLVSM